MGNKIHVHRLSPLGTDQWRALRDDGAHLFDIRLQISSMLNGSRDFVISPRGEVVRDGTFNFGVWDQSEIAQVLAAIVGVVSPGSEVHVELPCPAEQREPRPRGTNSSICQQLRGDCEAATVDGFEVDDGGVTSKVEHVFPDTEVPRAASLLSR